MPTFETPQAISLSIELVMGDVRVIASDRGDTVVEVHPRNLADSTDVEAAEQCRVEHSEGRVTVGAARRWTSWLGGKVGAIDVIAEVPTGSHVRANTATGDLRAEGVLGECFLKTATGDVAVDRATSAHLTTLDGRLTLERVSGDCHVTGSGEVRIGEIGGKASVKNLNGHSLIGTVAGDISLNSAHGDIAVDHPGGNVVARTAHGSVRIGGIARGNVVLQTASGDLEIGIREGTAAWLDVKSSYGTVRSELEPTGQPTRPTETAEVRGRTYDGDIIIRRAA